MSSGIKCTFITLQLLMRSKCTRVRSCDQGIMLVYDITNEKSFDNIKNWIRNIEEVRITERVNTAPDKTWYHLKCFYYSCT